MTLRFDDPGWWWALLALVPIALSWRWMDRVVPSRRSLAVVLRLLAVAFVVAALTQPQWLSTQTSLAVVGVIDMSGSTTRFSPEPPAALAQRFLAAAAQRGPQDRVGLVAFDSQARALLLPTSAPTDIDAAETSDGAGSSLAEAVALARALIPVGEAGRLVLMSDGLETIGSAARDADLDAGRIAIDIVLMPLERVADVSIDGFDVPATALPRSQIAALVALRTETATAGVLRMRMDDRLLRLAGDGADATGLPISLAPGVTRVRVAIPLGDGPVHRLDAVFEPSDPSLDRIPENSTARRVVAVPAGRSVLILGRDDAVRALDQALQDGGFEARRQPADTLPEDPLWLAGFDLVVLDDVPAAAMSPAAQRVLADHVQRLGGGVICVGGSGTFGAGGWRGSTLAELLPVEVEPPTEERRPRAALVFVIDRSGSMRQPVAGSRATQQQVANEAASLAIESIATRPLVGVIAFDNRPGIIVPLAPLDDPASVAERTRRISPDGGTAIGAALRAALDALDGIEPTRDLDQRLVVLLTDGVGNDDELLMEQASRAAGAGVVVTTISIGDAADDMLLASVAERTGGTFHPVRNPRVLPRVLVESVQSINRPLVREGVIGVAPRGDSDLARALREAPALRGVTVLGRPRSAETVIDAVTDLEEPLVARWPAGVGRVAIFASDAGEAWSAPWLPWRGNAEFWERLARWAARAPGSAPVAAEARIDDGRLTVTVEAAAADAIAGGVIDGIVRAPDGTRSPFQLRRVAPRRFTGSIDAALAGAWLAVLSPNGEQGPLPPILAAAVAPEGIEFARLVSDPGPLDALRRATGGREIAIEALAASDLFARDGLILGKRERSLAPWLLTLAALLFVCDAAVRRLAVRRQLVREALHVTSASADATEELMTRRRLATATAPISPASISGTASNAASSSAPGSIGVGAALDERPRKQPAVTEATGDMPAPPSEEEVRKALAALRAGTAAPAERDGPAETKASGTSDDDDASSTATVEALRRARDRSRIFPP